MTETVVEIRNRLGLHARAAAKFVHVAHGFESRIQVVKPPTTADGKSILGLLTLAASHGTSLTVRADGTDEREAIDALVRLIAERFGEDG